jgi:hypothetical protein
VCILCIYLQREEGGGKEGGRRGVAWMKQQHITAHTSPPVNMAQVFDEMQMISLVFISIDKMVEEGGGGGREENNGAKRDEEL